MSDAVQGPSDGMVKHTKYLLILGFVLFLSGGAGGYYTVSSGLVSAPESFGASAQLTEPALTDQVAYVPIDPLIVTLRQEEISRQLRFSAQIEVYPEYQEEVAFAMPRILDTLNGYLRAVELEDMEDALALLRIRLHIFHRIDVIVGPEKVRDILITEFVLS